MLNNKFIPYGRHFLDDDDIDSVVEVLKNGMLTQGPKVEEFEALIAHKVDAKHAVAVSSGTAALHLACQVAGLTSGDKLITSANTFVASANAAEYLNASPSFCDIDDTTLNMSINELKEKVESLENLKIIMPVHFAGAPCDVKAIQQIAKKQNSIIIEDASHALGATYATGEMVGSCKYSDMTIFSLHPVKGVTAGEGGVITTNNLLYAKKLRLLRSHGILKGNFDLPGISKGDDLIKNKKEAFDQGELNPWYYEMQSLGYNYRITDIQCALAISQLGKIDKFINRRKEIARLYDEKFRDLDFLKTTQLELRNYSSHHLYVVRFNLQKMKISKRVLMERLFENGIGTQVHYIPVPLHPYYEEKGFSINDFPNTKNYYEEALSLPIYFGLSDNLVDKVVDTIIDIFSSQL